MKYNNKSIAPIVLFVYNRPWHTAQTLDALAANELAGESILYIYSDGAKKGDEEDQVKVAEVRKLIRSKKWCKETRIIESDANLGLAGSVIKGVADVVNEHGKVIVLEDDIVTSKGFLTYMNTALDLYQNEQRVFHISGYMFPVKGKLPTTFFYQQTSCWGWATWADKWKYFEPSAAKLFEQLLDTNKIERADIDGTNQFVNQLKANVEGRLKTWAVLWQFSVFLRDGLALHPNKSLLQNIGNDGSGSNTQKTNQFEVKPADYVPVKKIKIEDYKKVYRLLKSFYSPEARKRSFYLQNIKSVMPAKIKRPIKKIINRSKYNIQKLDKELEDIRTAEQKRIQNMPRFFETDICFLDKKIRISDIASFQFMKREIFDQEIYKFQAETDTPYIVDCGANIGLSVIYFKQLFQKAEIIGFEPDNKVFQVLQHNIEVFGLSDVQLINKACWNTETKLKFYSEGADGGRAAKDFDNQNIIEVETTRLRSFLNKRVDFLKMDIEGAENEVLHDIQDLLGNVEKLFVEFHSFVGKEQMLPEVLGILKKAGYRIHISSPGLISQKPFMELKTYANMDNQLNIYAFR